jgi:hypothetical protein
MPAEDIGGLTVQISPGRPRDRTYQENTAVLVEPRAESVLTPGRSAHDLPAETAVWSTITQIYEGTNQIQRMVMARQAGPRVGRNHSRVRIARLMPGYFLLPSAR